MTKQSSKLVLCIGSDPVHLNLRCSRLRKLGFEVLSSDNGHGGLMRFARESIDCVVLDLDSHGAESALIAGQIKMQRPGVPIIMLFESLEELSPGATDQADAVLLKSEEQSTLGPQLAKLWERL